MKKSLIVLSIKSHQYKYVMFLSLVSSTQFVVNNYGYVNQIIAAVNGINFCSA